MSTDYPAFPDVECPPAAPGCGGGVVADWGTSEMERFLAIKSPTSDDRYTFAINRFLGYIL